MNDKNIPLFESIVRVFFGILVFVSGYRITDFVSIYESGGYPHSLFYDLVFRFHNFLQILFFFVGFVLFFTGVTRFSPLRKLLSSKR